MVSKRRHRYELLAKAAGRRAKKVISQGAMRAALYGACVSGVPDGLLLQLRRLAATAVTPRCKGRSLDIALAIADMDPTAAATAPPLARWAAEVWYAGMPNSSRCFCIRDLRDHWHCVAPHTITKWSAVRGPMTAAA
eukprot:9809512-Karenia_brevis.AAC.1